MTTAHKVFDKMAQRNTQSRKRRATTSSLEQPPAIDFSTVQLSIPNEFQIFCNEFDRDVCASLSTAEICLNRYIEYEHLKSLAIMEYFERYNFTNILTKDVSYSHNATLLFYANLSMSMDANENHVLHTQIGQSHINITLEDWSSCFGFQTRDAEGKESIKWFLGLSGCETIPRGTLFDLYKEDGWTLDNFNKSMCCYKNVEMRVLLVIVKYILSGCGSKKVNKNFISHLELHLMHFVRKNVFFNLSFFMFHAMLQVKNSHLTRVTQKKGMDAEHISFSNLITIYLKKNNILLPENEITNTPLIPTQKINRQHLFKLGFDFKDGKYVPKNPSSTIPLMDSFSFDELNTPSEQNFQPEPSTENVPLTYENFATLLNTSVAPILSVVQSLDTRFTHFQTSIDARLTHLETSVDNLGNEVQTIKSLIHPENNHNDDIDL